MPFDAAVFHAEGVGHYRIVESAGATEASR
jgi:hypothetical protein